MTAYAHEDVKMRNALRLVFWLCVVGTFIQVPLLAYEFWLLTTGITFSELTVAVLLTEHITFLAWIVDLIRALFGAGFGGWILGLPITLVTIFKLIFSTLIGYWALVTVRSMDASRANAA